MRAIVVVATFAVLLGCEGEAGPQGPVGAPGQDGSGVEWVQYYGVVPTSGTTTVTVLNLNMDCPPLVDVYLETTPGNWIPTPILDTYDAAQENGRAEIFIMRDNAIEVSSITAIATGRPTPFIITILAPAGYFTDGYECP